MKKFLLFNAIALFLSLFVAAALSIPYISSKISPYSSLGFYSVVEEDFKSSLNKNYHNELLKGEKIAGTFTASADNLGIILVRFYNFGRLNYDTLIFRLKEEKQKKWNYEYSYKVDQFQPNQYFTFGFPQIPDSKNKRYSFELESTSGKEGDAVAISEKGVAVAYVYKYSKTKILENREDLLQFSFKKTKYTLDNINKKILIISYFSFLAALIILSKTIIIIRKIKKGFLFFKEIFVKLSKFIKRINLAPFFIKIGIIIKRTHPLYLFIKKYKYIFFFTILASIVLFSVGKTLNYYFFTDDYSVFYHIQSHQSSAWPYNNVIYFFTPFYKIFGLQAEPYFALGIITLFLASIAVYFLFKILTKNDSVAIFSSFIFATGYIGIDQFSLMSTSSINNLNIINICITLILFILWLDTRKLRYYFAALLAYWISIYLFPFRAFALVLFIPIIGIILPLKFSKRFSIFKFFIFRIIAFLPFLATAYLGGIFSYGTKGTLTVVSSFSNSKILELLNYSSILEILKILGYLVAFLLPPKLIGSNPPYYLFGFIFFVFNVLIAFLVIKTYERLGKSLLIGLFITMAGYLGYYVLSPSFNSNGEVNRYLLTSFLGYSAIFPVIFYLFYKKISVVPKIGRFGFLFFIPILAIILTMISFARSFENNNIRERGVPAREFFRQLKKYLPSISGNNIFYFNYANHYPVASRFGNIMLGAYLPKEATLAVQYQVPLETVKIVYDIDSLTALIKNKKIDVNNIYTFYYDENGLQQTTKIVP